MEEIVSGVFVETNYEGGNVAAIVGAKGFICIDAPAYPRDARHWLSQLRQISSLPVQLLILTDYHGDRILNSRWFNAPILGHQKSAKQLKMYDKRYPATLLDSLLSRNSDLGRELINSPVDQLTFSFMETVELYMGITPIHLSYAPGPTKGNIWVHLPEEKLLFTGDTVVNGYHPLLQDETVDNWLASLGRLKDPSFKVDYLVPGRGMIGDKSCADKNALYLGKLNRLVKQFVSETGGDQISSLVPELHSLVPEDVMPKEWLLRQLKQNLEIVLVELQKKMIVPPPLPPKKTEKNLENEKDVDL